MFKVNFEHAIAGWVQLSLTAHMKYFKMISNHDKQVATEWTSAM